jgi:hypothetical protein
MNTNTGTQAEWEFLRALCELDLPATVRREFCARLPKEKLTGIESRVIFEEICAVTTGAHLATAGDLREQLRGRVTARGFPDLDFEKLLGNQMGSPEEAATRVEKCFVRISG